MNCEYTGIKTCAVNAPVIKICAADVSGIRTLAAADLSRQKCCGEFCAYACSRSYAYACGGSYAYACCGSVTAKMPAADLLPADPLCSDIHSVIDRKGNICLHGYSFGSEFFRNQLAFHSYKRDLPALVIRVHALDVKLSGV